MIAVLVPSTLPFIDCSNWPLKKIVACAKGKKRNCNKKSSNAPSEHHEKWSCDRKEQQRPSAQWTVVAVVDWTKLTIDRTVITQSSCSSRQISIVATAFCFFLFSIFADLSWMLDLPVHRKEWERERCQDNKLDLCFWCCLSSSWEVVPNTSGQIRGCQQAGRQTLTLMTSAQWQLAGRQTVVLSLSPSVDYSKEVHRRQKEKTQAKAVASGNGGPQWSLLKWLQWEVYK